MALDASGYSWEIHQEACAAGRLIVNVEIPRDGEGSLKLIAEYPDSYPYFPPYVWMDHIAFPRHQHPVGKNLCLLAREGEAWRPGIDNLAWLLKEQFPKVQHINAPGTQPEMVAIHEDHVGEPLSSFLTYPPNRVLIVPDDAPAEEHRAGRLQLKVQPVPPNAKDSGYFRGIVKVICDLQRNPLVSFSASPSAFSFSQDGFWMRLDQRPEFSDETALGHDLLRRICANVPAFAKALSSAKRGQILIAGFLYEDEVQWRQRCHDWLFLAVRVEQQAKGSRPAKARPYTFIRTDWGGEQAWTRRAPALRPLRTKSALVIGQGSLGSSVTLHLARAGMGEMHLVDDDYLQVGNTLRWALGWQYAGLDKVSALMHHLGNDYPYTKVTGYNVRLGMPSKPNEVCFSDYQLIRSIASKVDVIVDASANHRVSHFLSDLSREILKPYVWLTTTHGCAGGIVGRVVPGGGQGCWHCFLRSLADGTIRPPADSGTDSIQPGGCSQATFVGAGIDSDEIALLGARLAIATVCKGESSGYPDFAWNVAVADLHQGGMSIAPAWANYPLDVNTACQVCNSK